MTKKIRIMTVMMVMSCLLLTGCMSRGGGGLGLSSYHYDDAGKYSMGGETLSMASAAVSRLEIDWISGEVEIIYHPEETIIFSETANQELDENMTMRYWVDGNTLRIKFAKAGDWKFNNIQKSLTVYLPEKLTLNELEIDTTSAGVIAQGIRAMNVEIDTVSGGIDISEAVVSDSFSADTTSGQVAVMFAEPLSELEIGTVSGGVQVSVSKLTEFDIDSTSGAINLSAESAPKSGEISTVSGSVELILPETAEFRAGISTVSGQIESEIPLNKDGKYYICGSGACRYEIDTTSGNISFRLR